MANTPGMRLAIRFRSYDRKWTEVWGSSRSNIEDVLSDASNITSAALAFRHPSVYIQYYRASNPLAPRQARSVNVPSPTLAIGSTLPETTAVSALYQLLGSDVGTKRNVWLRGLKEADVRRVPSTGADQPANNLDALVQAYYQALRTNNFGIGNLQPVDGTTNARHPIASITVGALGVCTVNSAEGFTVGVPPRMVLYRIDQKFFPGLKGRFSIIASGASFQVVGYTSPMPVGTYGVVGASFRTEQYRFSSFRNVPATFLAFNTRDTSGGPLSSRGRSPAKIKRSSSILVHA
jgi:hypothetical protein